MTADDTGAPFRGGFRFVPGEDGRIGIDVWGADLTELLPRAAEAVSRAAGSLRDAHGPAEQLTLDVGSDTEPALVASVVANVLATMADDGFHVESAACRALATADAESGFEVRYAARLVCHGVRVADAAAAGLERLADDVQSDVEVARENGILRARFHVTRADGPA